jgi:hypothetical protein
MSFLDRIPFLPKQQGKRELVFFFSLAAGIMLLGLVGGMTGLLYKDVPESNTSAIVEGTGTPTLDPTPFVTPED